jgi:hypothetical protein
MTQWNRTVLRGLGPTSISAKAHIFFHLPLVSFPVRTSNLLDEHDELSRGKGKAVGNSFAPFPSRARRRPTLSQCGHSGATAVCPLSVRPHGDVRSYGNELSEFVLGQMLTTSKTELELQLDLDLDLDLDAGAKPPVLGTPTKSNSVQMFVPRVWRVAVSQCRRGR